MSQSPPGAWEDSVFEGVLEPVRNVEVATSEFGILRELYVKPGTSVKVGDRLARLDSRELESQLIIAKAEYESRGKLEQVESERELQSQKLASIREL